MSFQNICLDDGTGRNVYFVDANGTRSRKEPENYQFERFENGDRRYYFRGSCIRCRKKSPSVFISKGIGSAGYSLNLCEECTLQTTTEIEKIRHHGDDIWNNNIDTPKSAYLDLTRLATDINRDTILVQRAKAASFSVKTLGKLRRNAERLDFVKRQAADYGITQGVLVSWGFGKLFDEYFGAVDEVTGEPSGLGVRFYNDGSVYCGEWAEGKRHAVKGMWTRPDESQYEGSWVAGLKHGKGTQQFPDGSVYKGEFAKGYEHGQGLRTYPDGSRFEGRYRFGKRDGPGVFTNPEGVSVKRNFKDSEVFHEKSVPDVTEQAEDEEDDGSKNYFEPKTLLQIGIEAVARAMHAKRSLLPSDLLHRRLAHYMKPLVAKEYLETITPLGRPEFILYAPSIAFQSLEAVGVNDIKFVNKDMDSLLYLIGANKQLTSLSLTYNRLDPVGLDMVSRALLSRTWPLVREVNLSFNKVDQTGLQNLLAGLERNPGLHTLVLSGCKINSNGAFILSKYLTKSSGIAEVDLSFNALNAAGAEHIAEAIEKNRSLTSMNLRSNNIGSVGGQALANAVRHSDTLRVLCVADNKIGVEIVVQLSALLKGSIVDVARSVRYMELSVPQAHKEKTGIRGH